MSKYSRSLVCLALALTFTIGCAPDNEYKTPPPPSVTVAQPIKKDVTNFLEETGTTESVARAEVRARVRGFLEEVRFEAGTQVKKDDILYVIQQREFKAKRDAAKAAVDAEEVELGKAEIEYDRQLRLEKDNATAEVEVVAARAARDSALAVVAASQAALDQAELDFEYTEVTAPISGRVDKTLVLIGNLVGDGEATHLTTITSYDPIYANFNISERDLLNLLEGHENRTREAGERPDLRFELQRAIDPGFPYPGALDFLGSEVDPSTGNFPVRGIFPNPVRGVSPNQRWDIMPGMFVRIRVPINKIEDALLIPERAMNTDQAGRYVLIVNAENVVERRNVTPGMKLDGMQQVTGDDLTADDWVIIDGGQRARSGIEVTATKTELSAMEDTPAEPSVDSPAPAEGEAAESDVTESSTTEDAPVASP